MRRGETPLGTYLPVVRRYAPWGRKSMPKHLDSVDPGGYVEPIDVAESDLQAAVDMLGLTDAQKDKPAPTQIYTALEDLEADTVRTVRAKTVDDDLRDLDELAKVASPETMTAPIPRRGQLL